MVIYFCHLFIYIYIYIIVLFFRISGFISLISSVFKEFLVKLEVYGPFKMGCSLPSGGFHISIINLKSIINKVLVK